MLHFVRKFCFESFNRNWSSLANQNTTIATASIRQPNEWASEDIVLVAADFQQWDIYIYIACESMSPLVYTSIFYRSSGYPILLAFYESGPYCGLVQSLPAISNGQAATVWYGIISVRN